MTVVGEPKFTSKFTRKITTKLINRNKPKKIKIKLKIILGIIIFNPLNAAIDVAIIGPNIQARGICKKSATIALGTEIKITIKNFFEKISFTFSKSIGIAMFLFIIKSIYP